MSLAQDIIERDEAERAKKSEIKFLGDVVARLALVKFDLIHERQFVEGMDRHLNITGLMADEHSVKRIKELAWKYRRQMPAPVRPKLPPHDPIVQELEARGG